MEIEKILLPVDGSDFSVKATEYALDFVKSRRGDIILMYSHKESLKAHRVKASAG